MADVFQLTHNVLSTYPITVRIDDGRQFFHISEFAAIQCPSCTLCYLTTLGARPCFLHTPGTSTTIAHLLGGLDGTGGLSIVGQITAATRTLNPDWIIIHVVNNEQVQGLLDTNQVSAYNAAVPLLWSPAWYAQQNLARTSPRHIGQRVIQTNSLDETGEYLIFTSTEEWSRLLLSLGEAPPE